MTKHKTGVLFLVILAGAVTAALSGCRDSETAGQQAVEGASNSSSLNIHKMGGDIDEQNAPQGADVSTMGGNIHLANVGVFAKAKTMGGNIAIDKANGPVDASTMGGVITIGQASGAIHASTMGGDIKARIVGSSSTERDVELTSHGGTMELFVPKDFPMEVRITLAYTRNAPRTYQIIDSIGLTQQNNDEWDNSHGSPRKYILAKGRVGNGLNHVEIKTVNGDVIIKQE
jgi:hypothetical protein